LFHPANVCPQALKYATSHEFTFLKNASLVDWVVAAVARYACRIRP
jgi:hypothetical protein